MSTCSSLKPVSGITWEKGSLHMKLRILRWRNHPGLPGWALSPMTSILMKVRKRELWERRRGPVTTEAEAGIMQLPAQNAWSYRSLKKPGSRIPYSLLEARGGRYHSSHPYEIIKLSCFEPLTSWLFVTAALEDKYSVH